MMAPMIECVVETGNEYRVAIYSHNAAEHKEQNMPNINTSSSPSNNSNLVIFFLIVDVTFAPIPTAPTNSNIAAMTTACFNEIALATSLAPIPHDMAKQTTPPITTNHRN